MACFARTHLIDQPPVTSVQRVESAPPRLAPDQNGLELAGPQHAAARGRAVELRAEARRLLRVEWRDAVIAIIMAPQWEAVFFFVGESLPRTVVPA